jgi:hypothetical protein
MMKAWVRFWASKILNQEKKLLLDANVSKDLLKAKIMEISIHDRKL